MKPKYKLIFFLLPFMLSMGECNFSCKTSTSPDDPTVNYYTYEVIYERPIGSLCRPSESDPWLASVAVKRSASSDAYNVNIAKQSDYLFIGQTRKVPGGSKIEICLVDGRRWKEIWIQPPYGPTWGNPHSVGNIFTLRCIETGFQKQLLNIVDNKDFSNLPAGFEAKKAVATIHTDGTITDE